jgi:multidrug efflux pump subunit AcrA (membrane-fusion protein)
MEGGAVAKREVTLGRREPGFVEVTAGIQPGERVVVEGTLKLRNGAEVIEQGAGAEPATLPAMAPAAAVEPPAT